MGFKTIAIEDLNINPMMMIGSSWWLVTAGNEKNGYNTMTASWGHLGAIWGREEVKDVLGLPTAVVYLRPQRYTKEYMDRESLFTLSIFDMEHQKKLIHIGTHSGRDVDKVNEVGLTPVYAEGTTYFAEAELVFICKKIYRAPLVEDGFIDKDLIKHNYNGNDFHHFYIGEIIKVLGRE